MTGPADAGVVYLIDASYFVFRAYYSMPPDMVDGEGNATHALYGFARFMSDFIEQVRPERIAAAFDESLNSETSFRCRIYPAYKANRESAPLDLKRQFQLCREFCRHLGVAELASEEYEADDIIGTLVLRARKAGLRSVIVTRDKDLSQLVRDGDVFWDYSGGVRYHYGDIAERFGVIPERMADYLALMGDAVDNIPGVPGVGKKTAAELLREFESMDHLYDNLEHIARLKIRGAATIAAKLQAHREAAYLARQLTVIATDMPLEISLENLKRGSADGAKLEAFFDAQGFGGMLRRQAKRIAG